MGAARQPNTEDLLRRAHIGDESAVEQLLERHRTRLREMVAVRLDPQVAARVDPSDVVQEAITDAALQLPDYLHNRPLPFYPWLRQLAWQRLVALHRHHVEVQKRSVKREQLMEISLPDQSAIVLADRLAVSGTRPSRHLMRKELQHRVRRALEELPERDREVLVLLYLEQLSVQETGSVLGLSEKAVGMRHLRALERIRNLLDE
jgi:RNA polymerase sigma-70 factor (ECF subfamily)